MSLRLGCSAMEWEQSESDCAFSRKAVTLSRCRSSGSTCAGRDIAVSQRWVTEECYLGG
ncbi:hypothetical protein CCUG62472_00830 [Mycobacteroides salmoniphilum]|uniref:Uncharacterized protein n=1 Tax=Mycobacteroides salmoniphilum TaxID=404941 RepID=A0A4R8T0D6_9MYCO|nr:hypothetical protein CCUG62472_00830 [Mycobacteroides salmoniphilum]TEA09683.1 hypothetical protein CCUG60884_00075 [Mycobacteroides salmoniphilum]